MITDFRNKQLQDTIADLEQKIVGYQKYIAHLERLVGVPEFNMKDVALMFSDDAVMTGIGNTWSDYDYVEVDID